MLPKDHGEGHSDGRWGGAVRHRPDIWHPRRAAPLRQYWRV